MKFSFHSKDWCHFCGFRENPTIDIFYSDNAENNPNDISKYVRICFGCIFSLSINFQTNITKTENHIHKCYFSQRKKN